MFDSRPAISDSARGPTHKMSLASTNPKSLRILANYHTRTTIITLHHGERHALERHAHPRLSDDTVLEEGLQGRQHSYN